MDSRPSKHLPLLAALVAVLLWAAAFVGIRAAGRSFSPGPLALGRLALGSVLLGALVLSRPTIRPTRRELALLVLGGALAFAGVVVIGLATSSRSASLLGVILCVAAALASAIGMVAEKPVLNRIAALQATWTCCLVGALFCLPYAPQLVREWRVAPPSGIAWLLFLGVFPTSIAFTTWAYALARGSAGRLAATAYLVPPLTIVLSWLILGEMPGVIAVLGGALCLVGVAIARKAPAVTASAAAAASVPPARRP